MITEQTSTRQGAAAPTQTAFACHSGTGLARQASRTGTPDAVEPSDERLCAAVQRALLQTGHGCLRDVRVTTEGGYVFLYGHVSTYYVKQRAQHAAMAVRGVTQLHNELSVE